ncbi:14 kDa fatty acid-binding protein-like [Argonauta hians]
MSLDIFTGTWQQVEVLPENVKEYMNALDVPETNQTEYAKARLICEYSGEGDNWVAKISYVGMSVSETYPFKIGEEYSGTLLGLSFKGKMIKLADNKVKEFITDNSGKEIVSIKTVENGEMTVESTVKGVTCVSKFKKL